MPMDGYRACCAGVIDGGWLTHYADENVPARHDYLDTCWKALRETWAKVPADGLPFSNVWIAHETANRIPAGSVLFLGILNTLRTWNYFDILAWSCYRR